MRPSALPHRAARPIWLTVPGIALQSGGVVLLPFFVGLVVALFFDVSEVAETLPALLAFSAVVLVPVTFLQALGLLLKSNRELRWWWGQGQLGPTRFFDVVYEHLRVVTARGWSLLFAGLTFTFAALAFRWASFGILAVLGLFLFYISVGITLFVSTFMVFRFERSLGKKRTEITRQMVPAVTQTGESVEEVFRLTNVPVPWGYVLLIDDPNPVRLRTTSRYAFGAAARNSVLEARGTLRATPRGHFALGPARIWYQDMLGITRVSVASMASAELKILPRIRAVQIIDPPRTPQDKPDVITKPHRQATEDHFRFREYAAGDDTRRIHWRLSMRSGHLQVRQPETRETSSKDILLVLDTYLPPGKLLNAAHGAEEILDALVDAFLGAAKDLSDRGDSVTLVVACRGASPDEIVLEQQSARRGDVSRWQDLGARVQWQSRFDVPELLTSAGTLVHAVVVTSRFTAPPPGQLPGQTQAWLFMDPVTALGPKDPHWLGVALGMNRGPLGLLDRIFRLPHPIGSDQNAFTARMLDLWHRRRMWAARDALRKAAQARAGQTRKQLAARGDAVYQLERRGNTIFLVGLHAAKAKRQ